MTTVSISQENVSAETAQASTGLFGRLLDWMINTLHMYFGLDGNEAQTNHASENYDISDPCCCG